MAGKLSIKSIATFIRIFFQIILWLEFCVSRNLPFTHLLDHIWLLYISESIRSSKYEITVIIDLEYFNTRNTNIDVIK